MPPFLIRPRRPCPRSPSAVLPYIACKRVIPIQDASPQFPNVWLGSLAQDGSASYSSGREFGELVFVGSLGAPSFHRHILTLSPSHPRSLLPHSIEPVPRQGSPSALLFSVSTTSQACPCPRLPIYPVPIAARTYRPPRAHIHGGSHPRCPVRGPRTLRHVGPRSRPYTR